MDAPSADIAPGASQATAPGAATRLPHQARAMVLGLTLGVDDGLVGYATLLVLVLVLALGGPSSSARCATSHATGSAPAGYSGPQVRRCDLQDLQRRCCSSSRLQPPAVAHVHSVLQRPAPPGRRCAPPSLRSRAQGTRRLWCRSRPDTPPACSGEPGAPIPPRRGRSTAPVGASRIVIAGSGRARRRPTCVPPSTRAAARAASLAGVAACSAARSRTTRLSRAPPAAHAGRRKGSRTARRPSRASPFVSADDATRSAAISPRGFESLARQLPSRAGSG